MFRRKRLRFVRGPLPFRYVFVISSIIFAILTAQGLWIVERNIKPTLVEIAKAETQRIAQQAINDAVSSKMVGDLENFDEHDLVITEKDDNGKITSARINAGSFNRILSAATSRAQEYLNQIERGEINQWAETTEDPDMHSPQGGEEGVVHYISLGKATHNTLLANLGPKIPIRFHTIGEVQSKPISNVKLVGINNIWIEINIRLEVNVNVVVPFATETDTVTTNVPLVFTLINGEVPEFYNNSSEGMPPAIVPNMQ